MLAVALSLIIAGAAPAADECAQLGSTPAADWSTAQRTGGFEYALNGSRWSEEKIVGTDGQPVTVEVLFVDVTAKNVTDKPAAVPWAELKGTKGEPGTAVLKSYLRACTFAADPLPAGESRRAYFVFDIPRGEYSLVVFGGQDAKERGTDPLELALPAAK